MIALDHPRPTPPPSPPSKFSLFRRFSRKSTSPEPTTFPYRTHREQINHDVYNTAVRSPPGRLRKRSLSISNPLPSPPLSPARSKNDSVIDLKRSPSPHLTKDKVYRKDRTITHMQRNDIPQVVRERLSRESSSSSISRSTSTSSSNPSTQQRVQPNHIPTTPFPPRAAITMTPWDIYLPPSQVHALYLGYAPRDMADKWFIYSEGPDVMGKLKVHFHRSWTGQKIAEVFVVMDVKGEGAGKIVGLKWIANGDVGSGRMTEEEAKYLVRTTAWGVLGVELEQGRD
ncbi:hypothetical protein FB567DRAFT_240651 [Paraphoma chrysanthemicola]|uniref:Uncharacterized protein n=1 Tax=Paraphoma chrysanthemicola TaxID=798071 RepID=A0A8K0RG61_9PLEO|nr:hypothetical protein FB567DRAFT_240651 [Paraphoma chrysanthemicola]